MAEVLQDSPYANKLPRPYNQVQEGLGYSRHYAQRIRDMGKNSKDTWIKKLWNHMFQSKQHKSNGGSSNRRERTERELYYGQETNRSKSRQNNPALHESKSYSSSPTGHKSKHEYRREDGGRKSRGESLSLKRGKTMDEIHTMKKEEQKPSNTPNLPPIIHGSPLVSQKQEHHRGNKFAKTKTGPSSAFIQTVVSSTLYDDSDESESDVQAKANEEDTVPRSKSIKRNTFFRDGPPPRTQTSLYPKTTKSAEQRLELNRPSKISTQATIASVPVPPSHQKPEYKVLIQGRETKIETRKYISERKQYPNKYDRKLRRIQDTYDGNRYMKPKSHPFLSSQNFLKERESEDKKYFRNPQAVELEKKAKIIVEKAVKDGKIFTCDAPYPVDTYVRISLRKRGWVEKFGPKANNATNRAGANGRADTETEDDFDAICGQEIPLPWEEEHGLYAVCSRLVRHCPAKFIWGGKNVNSMVLRSEVITNHFPKARFFSSKTGLTSSLRELMWINSSDSSSFFPRCFTLCNDEHDDIVEDFRLTACMSLLKWVLKMYISKKHRDRFQELLVRRENTKYEEVKFGCSDNEDNGAEEPERIKKHKNDNEENQQSEESADEGEKCEDDNSEDWEDEEDDTNTSPTKQHKRHSRRKSGRRDRVRPGKVVAVRNKKRPSIKPPPNINFDYFDEDYESDFDEQAEEEDMDENEEEQERPESVDDDVEMTDVQEGRINDVKKADENKKYEKSELNPKGEPRPDKSSQQKQKNSKRGAIVKKGGTKSGHTTPLSNKPANLSRSNTSLAVKVTTSPPKTPYLPNIKPNMPSRSNTMPSIQLHSKKPVLPDLKHAKSKKGGEVPLKAVDWAIYVLDKYVKCKSHDDLDSKNKNLTSSQWTQLLKWYHQVAHEGYTVPNMTEGKLKESDAVLKKMKKVWTQYDIDGKRNMWIVKPGDKSKGIGIEFACKLEEILKYINNATTAGTYIVQKYIERPLLICNCKFDLRQWFIVTEWSPLTVWFYKECYLRICSQQYTVDNLHEAVHLSNVSVQQNYLNGKRDHKLPDNNFMTSTQFVKYLDEEGKGYAWNKVTYPGMKDAVISVLLATSDVAETRKNAFELYGADFILTEDYRPYLLEINCSPGMAPSSVEKARLCASVMDDTIKVVLDKKENKNADTGGFELIYKDNITPASKCVDTKFLVEGQRIKKGDLSRYCQIDQNETKKMKELETNKTGYTICEFPKEVSSAKTNVKSQSPYISSEETTVNLSLSNHESKQGQIEIQNNEDTTDKDNQQCHTTPIETEKPKPDSPEINTKAVNDNDAVSVDCYDWQADSQPKGESIVDKNNNNGSRSAKSAAISQQNILLKNRRIISPSAKSMKSRVEMVSFRNNVNRNKESSIYSHNGYSGGSAVQKSLGDLSSRSTQRRNAHNIEERIRQKEKIYSSVVNNKFYHKNNGVS